MPILQLIAVLLVIGLILGLFTTYAPIPQLYKNMVVGVVVVLVLIWLLSVFGLLPSATVPRYPR